VGFVGVAGGFVAGFSFAEADGAAALACALAEAELTGGGVESGAAVSTRLGVTVGSTEVAAAFARAAVEVGEPCVSADGDPTLFIAWRAAKTTTASMKTAPTAAPMSTLLFLLVAVVVPPGLAVTPITLDALGACAPLGVAGADTTLRPVTAITRRRASCIAAALGQRFGLW